MLRIVSACIFLLVILPAPAAAEWHFTPMVGWTFKGATDIIDSEQNAVGRTHKHLGGTISLLGGGIVGAEAVFIWTPSLFQGDVGLETVDQDNSMSLMGNVIVTTPRRWTEYFLRPYFSGGIGLMHASVTQIRQPTGPVFDPVNLDALGYNLGGGAIGFFTERTGVRLDFRYHSTFRGAEDDISTDPDTSYLRYMTFSVGVVIRRR